MNAKAHQSSQKNWSNRDKTLSPVMRQRGEEAEEDEGEERKEKVTVSEEITMQEWEEYFIKLLERGKEKGEAETEMKKKQKRQRKQKSQKRGVLGVDIKTPGKSDTEYCREKKKNTEKKEREKYYQRSGYASEAGRQTNIDLSERDKDIDKQERRERIKESRWRDLEYGNEEREETSVGWKGRKEGAECV
ncbi:hypothetical protein GEV33_006948 [Tenebrio molitor]|uniref:Uncharacterized protein n=1 Tax=Tenebrio molitor TaxID=7067 RepID=A0A8J6LDH4_TENMO|nr:hypothetical protein GEV33_006948 [Tenebrio molitor]